MLTTTASSCWLEARAHVRGGQALISGQQRGVACWPSWTIWRPVCADAEVHLLLWSCSSDLPQRPAQQCDAGLVFSNACGHWNWGGVQRVLGRSQKRHLTAVWKGAGRVETFTYEQQPSRGQCSPGAGRRHNEKKTRSTGLHKWTHRSWSTLTYASCKTTSQSWHISCTWPEHVRRNWAVPARFACRWCHRALTRWRPQPGRGSHCLYLCVWCGFTWEFYRSDQCLVLRIWVILKRSFLSSFTRRLPRTPLRAYVPERT